MRASAKQYAKVLYELTAGKSSADIQKSVADFARYIYKERKLKLSDKIIESFGKIYNQKNGIVEAEVVTARKLEDSKVRKVEDYIKKIYKAEKAVVKNVVDPDIKGGMVLKIGDEIIDGSLRGKLNELKKVLV